MLQLNISEVKRHFSETFAKVKTGETIIVCKRNKPIGEIRPITDVDQATLKKLTAGYGVQKYPDFELPDNFNAPLPAEKLKYFMEEQ
jgi:prevent-host-death family protein